MPEDQTEDRRELLAYASFRLSSPRVPPNTEDDKVEDEIWSKKGRDLRSLEVKFVERLVPRLGIPLQIKSYLRPGTAELAVLMLGYTLLRDYKPLRESLELLTGDIRTFFEVPEDWEVALEDVRTPGNTVPETSAGPIREMSGGIVGMGVAARYAFLYLLITNILALIFLGYLALTLIGAATGSPPEPTAPNGPSGP